MNKEEILDKYDGTAYSLRNRALLAMEEYAQQQLAPSWELELIILRNNLVDAMPVGDVKAWDLIKLINAHIQDLDKLIESQPAQRATDDDSKNLLYKQEDEC